MELRVHGIGSHEPFEVLGAPTLKFGDARNGCYRMFEPSRRNVHAFVWSRTTRQRLGAYRYLLLPFTLLNVAGYAQSGSSDQDSFGGRVYRFLVQVLGVTVTVSYIYWLWAALVDLPSAHGAGETVRIAATWSVLGLVLGPMIFRALVPGGRSDASALTDPCIPLVGTEGFWTRRPTRRFYLGHLLGTLGLLQAINIATGWRQDLLLTLVAIQLVVLVFGGAVVLWRIPHIQAPERGGLILLLVAVALPHAIMGSLLLAGASTLERFHRIEPTEMMTLVVLRPTPYWQLISTYFVVAISWIAGQILFRILATQSDSPTALDRTRVAYGIAPGVTPTWLARLTRHREQPLIRNFPQDLLHAPRSAALALVLPAVAGWNGVFSRGDHLLTSLFRPLVRDYWYGLTILLMVVVTAVTIYFFRSHSTQKQAAMVFDVLGFWPRAYHPFSPPAYAEATLNRLPHAVTLLTTSNSPLFLIGHSQGSVLAYCAAWRLDERVRAVVHLITCGSPLKSLYARLFPRYFSSADFDRAATALPAWWNFHRDTDPIASAIFERHQGDVTLLEANPEATLHGHSDYWEDPTVSSRIIALDSSARIE